MTRSNATERCSTIAMLYIDLPFSSLYLYDFNAYCEEVTGRDCAAESQNRGKQSASGSVKHNQDFASGPLIGQGDQSIRHQACQGDHAINQLRCQIMGTEQGQCRRKIDVADMPVGREQGNLTQHL